VIPCSCCERQVSVAWLTTKDKPACERCLRYAPDCPFCERAILPGDGVIRFYTEQAVLANSYCHACAQGRPTCRHCHDPIFEDDAEEYCSFCLQRCQFCVDCGQVCTGIYYAYEHGVHCSACRHCQSCWAQGDLQNGLCEACRTTQMNTLEEGLELYPAAYEFLHEVMGLSLRRIPDLRVSLEKPNVRLRRYAKAKPAQTAGLCSTEGWIWARSGRAEHVSVLILVHELGHAWQFENCPFWLSDVLNEGFACWLEYKCALNLNYPEYAQALRDRDCPVYGGGLRACLAWEEAVGTEEFLLQVRYCWDLPLWLKARRWLGLAA